MQVLVQNSISKSDLPGCFRGVKILVAEDDDTNYFLLKEYLNVTQAEVIRTHNGLETLQFCQQNNPDIILMDIQMPVMNGLEAMSKIKRDNPNIPIVATTAYAMHGDNEKYLSAGFSAYTTKPLNKIEFINLIFRLINTSNV